MTRYSHLGIGRLRALSGLVLCALSFPVLAAAQNPPLADIARKEAERRKTAKPSPKVITTKDLPESARRPNTAPPGDASAGTASGEGAAASATPDQKTAGGNTAPAAGAPGDVKDENYWRGRMSQAQENVRRNEAFAEALQSRINSLTTDFVSRDDTFQRGKLGEDRQKAMAELERVKSEVTLGKQQIADIEEEARKAGVPPGWLR